MPSKRRRRFRRKSKFRDAKSIVIASEGTKTEPAYFESLALDENYRNPRIKVEVIRRNNTKSSPAHVMKELDRIRKQFAQHKGDELWLVLDRDKWTEGELSNVVQQVEQKAYSLADSNPCFEIWLLLHRTSLDEYDEDGLTDLMQNKRQGNRTRLERELVELHGSYYKSSLNTSHYIPFVTIAIANAKLADTRPTDRWLNQIGSRVYRLAQSIINSAS